MKSTQYLRRSLIVAVLISSAVYAFAAKSTSGKDAEQTEKSLVRIGIFDSRAIAVAYAHSEYNENVMQDLMKKKKKAEKKGDAERVAEIEKQGERLQDKMHRQTFGKSNVDDLLEPIMKRLDEVAKKANLDIIADDTIFTGPGVETVDVTKEIVALFDPSPRTLNTVKELKKTKPLAMNQFPLEQH